MELNIKKIRAVYTEETIRVYQAYNEEIAKEAVELGTFGPKFLLNRMTWIKPSFLWMMYRSGWAKKSSQEHILAIDIKRSGFDEIINEAMPEYGNNTGNKLLFKSPNLRIQWDPERDINGNPKTYRAIQIGIKGPYVEKYIKEWIAHIEDITPYVINLRNKKDNNEDISEFLPQEKEYILKK